MKIMKKTIYFILAIALIFPSLFSQTSHASASTTQTLNFNTTVTNTISNKNTEQVYKITLPSSWYSESQFKLIYRSCYLGSDR